MYYKIVNGPLQNKTVYIPKRIRLGETTNIHTWEGSTAEDHLILKYKRTWWKKLKYEGIVIK